MDNFLPKRGRAVVESPAETRIFIYPWLRAGDWLFLFEFACEHCEDDPGVILSRLVTVTECQKTGTKPLRC